MNGLQLFATSTHPILVGLLFLTSLFLLNYLATLIDIASGNMVDFSRVDIWPLTVC